METEFITEEVINEVFDFIENNKCEFIVSNMLVIDMFNQSDNKEIKGIKDFYVSVSKSISDGNTSKITLEEKDHFLNIHHHAVHTLNNFS